MRKNKIKIVATLATCGVCQNLSANDGKLGSQQIISTDPNLASAVLVTDITDDVRY